MKIKELDAKEIRYLKNDPIEAYAKLGEVIVDYMKKRKGKGVVLSFKSRTYQDPELPINGETEQCIFRFWEILDDEIIVVEE